MGEREKKVEQKMPRIDNEKKKREQREATNTNDKTCDLSQFSSGKQMVCQSQSQ